MSSLGLLIFYGSKRRYERLSQVVSKADDRQSIAQHCADPRLQDREAGKTIPDTRAKKPGGCLDRSETARQGGLSRAILHQHLL